MARSEPANDLARTTFQLLALGALIASSFWIVRPFLVASTWATMIAVATWPLLLRAQSWLGGRRSPAVAVMTMALLLTLVAPFYLGVTTIVENAGRIVEMSQSLATMTVPEPPSWVEAVPVVGTPIAESWQQLATASPEELSARLAPFAATGALWFVGQVGNVGLLLLQLVLTVVVVVLLYANGETAARGVNRFARRLAGAEGENAIQVAGRAIRAVALGVIVTAIVQSALIGLGLAVAGVPFAIILVALSFILSIAQIGPMPVLVGATIWVYSRSGVAWGTGFLVWAIACGALDNVMRPLLIKRGANLPLLLIFAGVIGGLVAFGVIGLFIGPAVLAVAYMLLDDWVSDGSAARSH
jgi:predicted PurR-regulated permease PerM